MDETIARLNIERFHKLLEEAMDEKKRALVQRLLQEEEAKLKQILAGADPGRPRR